MENKEKTDAEILMDYFRENYSYNEMLTVTSRSIDKAQTDEERIQSIRDMNNLLARMYNIDISKYVHINNEDTDKEK